MKLVDVERGIGDLSKAYQLEMAQNGGQESPWAKTILLAISVLKTLPEAPINLEEMYKKHVHLEPVCPVCGTLMDEDKLRWYNDPRTGDLVVVTQRIPNTMFITQRREL